MRLLALVLVGLILGVATAGARSVTGTPRSDQLFGTPRADLIRGLGGSDALLGGSGGDFLQGGQGRDTHDAGPGNDLIATSYDGARDVIRCGTGLDVVNADLPDSVASDCELVGAPALARSLPCGRRAARDRGGARQPHRRPDDRGDVPGRKTFDGAATNVGFAVTTGTTAPRGGAVSSPASPLASRPRARTRERATPSSRTTQRTRRGSSRPSPSRVRRPGSRSTARRRIHVGDALSRRARSASRRESRSTRTGSHATTLVVAVLRPLLPRVHALRRSRHARGQLV